MRLGSSVCLAALLGSALALGSVRAEPLEDLDEQLRGEPFTLRADSLHYDLERSLYVARGGVVIEQEGRRLSADWAAFNRETGRGIASGNVAVDEGGDVLSADFLEFELELLEGRIQQGRYESERSHFVATAAEIEKLADERYAFREGRFTTCRCEDEEHAEPWAIVAESLELQLEGYATARNARFEVFGLPVAWLPWAVFPVKTERQTGLLFPELSIGSLNGFELGLPFFWAIADEAGLLMTPRYSTDWGYGGAAVFDYATGPGSRGEFVGAYYHDLGIDANSPEEPFDRDRWSLSGEHHVALPGSLHLRGRNHNASDNEMPFDFDELGEQRRDRFLESQLELSRRIGPLGQAGAAVGGRFIDDLQSPDDLDRDRFLLQRWPEARLDLLPSAVAGVPWLVPSLDVAYAWFQALASARGQLPTAIRGGRDGIFLDTGIDALPSALEPGAGADPHADDFASTGGSEGDGLFQEGEPLADRGHRLLLQPRLALPLAWRGLQLVPELGWHQSLYDSRRRDFRQRGFLTARADLSARLQRDYGSWRHVLQPRVGYALALADSQSRNPLFVPGTAVPQDRLRALDLDALTHDDADRIARVQQIAFGSDSRAYAADGGLLAELRLLGLYDFEARDFDAVILDGRGFPMRGLDLRFHVDYDPDAGSIDEGLAELAWALPVGLRLDGAYRWVEDIPLFFERFRQVDRFDERSDLRHIHQLKAGLGLDLNARWSLRYDMAYTLEGQSLLANRGVLEYFSACGCWAVAVTVSQDRTRSVDASLEVRLLGLGSEWEPRGPGLLDALRALW